MSKTQTVSKPRQRAIDAKSRGLLFADTVLESTVALQGSLEKIGVECELATFGVNTKTMTLSGQGLQVKSELIDIAYIVEITPKEYDTKKKLIKLFADTANFKVELMKYGKGELKGELEYVALYDKKGGRLTFDPKDVEMID